MQQLSTPYPASLAVAWPLLQGQLVIVRPIYPDDIERERDFVCGLSAESRYQRMLSGGVKLTHEMLEKLTRVDYTRDLALAATVMLDDRETFIGVARYARHADSLSCEYALVVADAWHGQGLGESLLHYLMQCARRSGLRQMTGEVFAANIAALRLANKLGFQIQRHPDDPELRHVAIDLAAMPLHDSLPLIVEEEA